MIVIDTCIDKYDLCYRYLDKCSDPKNTVWYKWVTENCRKSCKLCNEGIVKTEFYREYCSQSVQHLFIRSRTIYWSVNISSTLRFLRLGRKCIFWQILSCFLVDNQKCMQNPVKHLRRNFVNGGIPLTILSKSSILDV